MSRWRMQNAVVTLDGEVADEEDPEKSRHGCGL
jgi:hypothetical protein